MSTRGCATRSCASTTPRPAMFDCPARRKSCSSLGDAARAGAGVRPDEQAREISAVSATTPTVNGRGRQQIRDLGDSGPSTSLLGCVTPTQDLVMALWKENSNTATAPAPTKDAPIMTPPPPAEAALKKEPDYAPTDIAPAPRRAA